MKYNFIAPDAIHGLFGKTKQVEIIDINGDDTTGEITSTGLLVVVWGIKCNFNNNNLRDLFLRSKIAIIQNPFSGGEFIVDDCLI